MPLIEKNKQFLIIRLSSFGDVLLTTPLLRSLQKNFPKAKIDFLLRKPFHQMIENNKNITLYFYNKTDIAKLKTIHYDLIIDLQNNIKSLFILKKLHFTQEVKYSKECLKRFLYVHFKANFFNTPIKTVPERYLDCIASYNLEHDGFLPHYYFKKSYVFPEIDVLNEPYICVAPGSAHFTKQWPKEFYSELIQKIKSKIVLLGSKTEIGTATYICLNKASTKIVNFVGKTSFDKTAYLIKHSEAVICNDSSIMHLATALKKKTLVFFGSTTKQFGFYHPHKNSVLLENNEISCRPCSHTGKKSCPKKHFNCMKTIHPDTAYIKLQLLLEK